MELQVQKYSHRGMEDGLVYCKGGVAADAAAEISAETTALIAGNNEDLVSYRAHAC